MVQYTHMANSSFSQQGALPGSASGFQIPYKVPDLSGIQFSPSQKATFLGSSSFGDKPSTVPSTISNPAQGSTTGLFDLSQNLPSPASHPGLIPGAKTGPLKSVTTPDGTTSTYHPVASGTPQPQAPAIPSVPTQGSPQDYANQVTQASQPSAVGQGAANASALYGMLGSQAQLAQFSNPTQGLLNSYANLYKPQVTGNLQGEEGLFNAQNGILQNAANTSAQQALEAQRIQQGGAEANLNASLPQSVAPGSSLYNPLGGSSGYDPISGAVRGAAYSALVPAYGDMNQAQGTLKNIQDNTDLFNTVVPQGVNVSDATPLNQLSNRIGSAFSSDAYGKFNAILPNIVSQYASYIGSTKGLTPSDAFDQAGKEINEDSSIGTIRSVLDVLSKEAANTLSAKQKVYNDALSSYGRGTASQDITGQQGEGNGQFGW